MNTSISTWPIWSLYSIGTLTALVLILMLYQFLTDNTASKVDNKSKDNSKVDMFSFRVFQLQYLSVYLTVMLADWLQGTNMYTLYKSYGVDVGTLFLTGFLSSAVFGTFLGIYVDRWGRKFGCILFCILEIAINTMEHSHNFNILLLGRIFGGLSTSLLFSAFESWMVSEHEKRGFSKELLASTFSISSWGNGLSAIIAGFLAQIASDFNGDIGPFQLAIVLSAISMLIVFTWRENYGEASQSEDVKTISSSIVSCCKTIMKHPKMLCLGLSQSFFEGAMYTFVFMWVPSMALALKDEQLPLGLVFSSFMLAMTLGGLVMGSIQQTEGVAVYVYIIATIAMIVPAITFDFWPVFISFLVFEASVGMFNSCGALLRSQYYPASMQSSIMTVFRLPLNLLVVIGTKLTDNAYDIPSLQFVFAITVGMLTIAIVLQMMLNHIVSREVKTD